MNITLPNLALVYHVPMTEEYSYVERLNPRASHPDPYLAGIVACDSNNIDAMLEQAFESTNHISDSWHNNTNVLSTGFGTSRSTSVGDYVQIGFTLYRCDPMGWTHIAPSKWQLIKSFFVGAKS